MAELGDRTLMTADLQLPTLEIHFNPTMLPPGMLELNDIGRFISAFQLYLTRSVAHSQALSNEVSRFPLSSDEPETYQTLLVFTRPSSLLALVQVLLQSQPGPYLGAVPSLIVHQQDPQSMGSVLLFAGQEIAKGGLEEVGRILVQRAFASRKKDAAGGPRNTIPNEQPPASAADVAILREELRNMAHRLDDVQTSLRQLAQGQNEQMTFIARDEFARSAAAQMANTFTKSQDLRDGSVSISVSHDTYNFYGIPPSEAMVFDKASSKAVHDRTVEVREVLRVPVAQETRKLVHGALVTMMGTCVRSLDYDRLNFFISVPPYDEPLECRIEPAFIELAQRHIHLGDQVVVTGIVYLKPSQGRRKDIDFIEVRDIRPFH